MIVLNIQDIPEGTTKIGIFYEGNGELESPSAIEGIAFMNSKEELLLGIGDIKSEPSIVDRVSGLKL